MVTIDEGPGAKPEFLGISRNPLRKVEFSDFMSTSGIEMIQRPRRVKENNAHQNRMGHLYITENYFAFYSNLFGYVTRFILKCFARKVLKS
ncbi:unnamed protein product [Cyprideis torosa]|uniref:Uncharacterized protein n=1 Tax=Cyprideis torosa TaxID=163714 RepID=A0A7R8ZG68_9CRUS|nr:unnamed protein product [Cyprideis torosa]CAG0879398.1 unnamed protein product [Cyprideis torosa]